LVQPDYEAQTLMEEAKFRQQLEQRSKRSEKKHGKCNPDPGNLKSQESGSFLICGAALKGLSHEIDLADDLWG
jgi:hypothetical protein